jgi:hypothetical protein
MKTPLALLLLIASPLAVRADTFDIKTGAWEVTMNTAMAGMMIPEDDLAKMPAARRAKMEEMMRARAGKVNTRTSRTCVTPEDLARGELAAKEKEKKNCTRKMISQTARRYEFEEVCTAPEPSKTHARFDAASPESYTASMDMAQNTGKVHVDMHGRWIGPTCKKGVDD